MQHASCITVATVATYPASTTPLSITAATLASCTIAATITTFSFQSVCPITTVYPRPSQESSDTRSTWLSKDNTLWQISIIVGSVGTILVASLIIFKRIFRLWKREDMLETRVEVGDLALGVNVGLEEDSKKLSMCM
ncbi:hypothetical protein CYMTET_8940 [Cymbomonas tetramitiformis]|uniref:Uncharacterized protein n=1 Tax=Cymbomonas tetramitiformis TaxID=36881 RepID=A0AAE0GS09_9CHLO|nr:hypothetical protein CYMTET_8940 [Cymbomonas tetramitiformis]